jgi:GH25 family lysozyme M1 (1,4-beta-N-acetylmuramidase)
MSQKLIQPINDMKKTADYKNMAYQNKFGNIHYGIDLVSISRNTTIYASGNGTVVATGFDNVVGNVIAVTYPKAYNRENNEYADVVFRYFHLASISVKVGDVVNKDTKLGLYGNTGTISTGAHLHLEADTDTLHPLYSPTVKNSSLLKGRNYGANDSTMSNPWSWLYCKNSKPDNQTFTTSKDVYINSGLATLPFIDGSEIEQKTIELDGIDISKHNGVVDWNKVRDAGKKFAFIRLGWCGWDGSIASNNGLDSMFHTNMKNAITAGIDVGIYLYSYAKTPQAAEVAANETLEIIKPYELKYPIAFDMEDTSDSGVRYDKMSKSDNSAIINSFMNTIKSANYFPILYTYTSFIQNYVDTSLLTQWDVWIAQYAKSVTYKGKYTIWQHHGDVKGFIGTCPGVSGNCDLNTSYKDYAQLIKLNGLNKPTYNEKLANELKQKISELEKQLLSLKNELSIIESYKIS